MLIESGVDVNQTESEHNLTALHVIVDAEYAGQSLRVSDLNSKLISNSYNYELLLTKLNKKKI